MAFPTPETDTTLALLRTYALQIAVTLARPSSHILFYTRPEGSQPGTFKQYEWQLVGTIDYDKEEVAKSFSLGEYKVVISDGIADKIIATFKLYQMPHCCAFIISCNAFVDSEFRSKGLGTLFNKLRQDIGRHLGYSTMMCTDIETNTCQRKLLAKNGWKDVYNRVNKRTGNNVFLSIIEL